MPSSLASLDGSFVDFLVGIGLSARTVGIYSKRIDSAILWFEEHDAVLAEASAAELAEWGSQLAPSTSTRRQARSAITHYLEWLDRPTKISKAIRVPPKPRYFCQAVTEHEAALLHKVALEEGHPRGTVIMLGLYLALRLTEIATARWDGFDATLERYTLTGKGAYRATLPVHDRLRAFLEPLPSRYVYLFPGERGRPHVHPGTVWGWVHGVGEKVGIVDLRPHQLRHTAIATLHDATGDLRTASEFARHRRIETTMIYSRTPEATLKKAVDQLRY